MDSFLSRSKRGLRRRKYKKLDGGSPDSTVSGPISPPTGPYRDPGTVMREGDAEKGLEKLGKIVDLTIGSRKSPDTVGHPSNDATTLDTNNLFVEAAETVQTEHDMLIPGQTPPVRGQSETSHTFVYFPPEPNAGLTS